MPEKNGRLISAIKVAGFIVTIVVLLIGGGIAYGQLKARVEVNTDTLSRVEKKQEKKADEKDIEEMKQDIKEIQRDIKKILEKLD